jgi:hypothetical protein
MRVGLLDLLIRPCFRDEKAGRVVVFPGDRRHRGYLVKSEVEEQKIRAFLKMFYCAHASILLLGGLLASGWSTDLRHVLDGQAAHALRTEGIFLGIYLFVVGVPYFLVWRTYKKSFVSFISPQDEVLLSGKRPRQQQVLLAVGMIVFTIAILLGVLLLIRTK